VEGGSFASQMNHTSFKGQIDRGRVLSARFNRRPDSVSISIRARARAGSIPGLPSALLFFDTCQKSRMMAYASYHAEAHPASK